MPAATRISRARADRLRPHLEALAAAPPAGPDPIDYVHRYTDDADREVAALIAASLAFGRVASFASTLDAVFALANAGGGPAAWAATAIDRHDPGLEPLFYRWVRGPDLQRLVRTIGRFRARHGSLARFMDDIIQPSDRHIGAGLAQLVDTLRALSLEPGEAAFEDLPRGFRHLLPHPRTGSACKRLCMLARWMTRTSPPDLAMWSAAPSQLIIPLDTHVHKVAKLLGLTRRVDGSWRTALEITRNLRRIDSDDPVRFDFALAHLGISGACKGRRVQSICDPCALRPVCKVGGIG